eukprot:m.25705 g.25705  ORF g.25705 m.25705 type:complete len:69 (+) comp28917_c0_seq2:1818-2024(+)
MTMHLPLLTLITCLCLPKSTKESSRRLSPEESSQDRLKHLSDEEGPTHGIRFRWKAMRSYLTALPNKY